MKHDNNPRNIISYVLRMAFQHVKPIIILLYNNFKINDPGIRKKSNDINMRLGVLLHEWKYNIYMYIKTIINLRTEHDCKTI